MLEAPSDDARLAAVIDVLAALHIGVYTPEGEPIVTGAERSATDFVVYDFQAEALALGVREGDEVYLEDVVAELSQVVAQSGAAEITVADVAPAVIDALTAAVADPGDPVGYSLQIARELGMRGPKAFDLAEPGDGPIILDALSAFLVEADLALPAVRAAEPPAVADVGRTASIGGIDPRSLTAADPCAKFGKDLGKEWYVNRGWRQLPGVSGGNAFYSKALQRRLFGGTVQMTMAFTPRWHHTHRDTASDDTRYVLGVKVRVKIPPEIKCGPAIGKLSGRVEGGAVGSAPVEWKYPKLTDHADVDCGTACTITNGDGIALLGSVPFKEPGPGGIGPTFVEEVPVTAQINLVDALGAGLLSMLAQPPDSRVLMTKRVTSAVSWHNAYEVRVEIESQVYVTAWGAKPGAGGKTVPQLFMHVTTASATGFVIATKNLRRADQRPAVFVDTYNLLVEAKADPALEGKCDTATVKGVGFVDFMVVDAVIWPLEKLAIQLDFGPASDDPDDGWLRVCDGRGNTVVEDKKINLNAWEHYLSLGYPSGMRFAGIGSEQWNVSAPADIWEQGGTLATWNNALACGGWCDPKKSWFNKKIILEVLPTH